MKQTLDLVQSLDVSVGYRRLRSARRRRRRRRRRPGLVFDQVFDGSDRRALELIDYNGSGVVTDAVDKIDAAVAAFVLHGDRRIEELSPELGLDRGRPRSAPGPFVLPPFRFRRNFVNLGSVGELDFELA